MKAYGRLSERAKLRQELTLANFWWDVQEGMALQDIFLQSGFYGEEDESYIKYG
jgi:hypothetical protein